LSKLLKLMALLLSITCSQAFLAVLGVPVYTLQVEKDGMGTITVTPNKSHFEEGTVVTLLATPRPGCSFIGWSVRIGDHGFETWLPEITITMTADANAKARFERPGGGGGGQAQFR
jgi:hypothetical protein